MYSDSKERCANEISMKIAPATSTKRSLEDTTDSQIKKKKLELRHINITEKNPISVLNELRIGLKYEVVEQLGPSHNPTFKVRVGVDGHIYYGTGNSKKAAKCEAASEALKSFIQFPSNGAIVSQNTICVNRVDFTSDSVINKKNLPKNKNIVKGPLMLLNELYPNTAFECTNNETDPYARFQATLKIGNDVFTGTGSNKKLAKNAAATYALRKLINYNTPELQSVVYNDSCHASKEDIEKADLIAKLVNEKFYSLMSNDLEHMKRKVLAGIVMTRGPSTTSAEVICVTTGTKCVSGEHISINGASLNDMHAEILSRRCLMSFFYDQLEMLLDPSTSSDSVFTLKSNQKGYQLKRDIEFHLYINTAPCGDARIFSPHEDNPNIDRHPNRISRGQLRTKIESGEGTIPVKNAPTCQTWDGIIQGERLLTMSCSDKVCRWNVLGLQGALLSHYIEPIYLKTIVLGSLFKEAHLYRAVCGRIENTVQGLPPPFQLNRPTMLPITSKEVRQPQKAPNFAVIWVKGLEIPEIISTITGKTESDSLSVVAKQRFASRFSSLFRKLSTSTNLRKLPITYMDAKAMELKFNAAKQRFFDAFKKAQLGTWVCKPIEQDMFDISTY